MTLNLLSRYLTHIGHKIRYVRNIVNVGYLECDADDGEGKVAKKARLEQFGLMEAAQYCINRYHQMVDALNVLPPSIEPHVRSHTTGQIVLVKEITKNGYAYEGEGPIYFDVVKHNEGHHYGKLSGRNLDGVLNTSRELDGQSEKYSPADFVLWKCAQPEYITHWSSPRSDGFSGQHAEYMVMGKKYPSENFDIHGGGMDFTFPHHECETTQSVVSQGHDMAHYWMYSDILTVNGQKIGKSHGNLITLGKLFTDTHSMLEQVYSPMITCFFTLQTYYRSMADFSSEVLQAAEKGLARLMDAVYELDKIIPAAASMIDAEVLRTKCYEAMGDDLNSPIVIVHPSEGVRMANNILVGNDAITVGNLRKLRETFHLFCFDTLRLEEDNTFNVERETAFGKVVDMLLEERMKTKASKDQAISDKVHNELIIPGFRIKGDKDGCEWKLSE